MMNEKQKREALDTIIDMIGNLDSVGHHKIDTFIALICSLEDAYKNDDYYLCFTSKKIVDETNTLKYSGSRSSEGEDSENTNGGLTTSSIFFKLANAETIKHENEYPETIAFLKILEQLLFSEVNRNPLVQSVLIENLIKQTFVYKYGDPKKNLPESPDYYSRAEILFKILILAYKKKEYKLLLVKNRLLGSIVEYLLVLKKVKETRKEFRKFLNDAKKEGSKFIVEFYKDFYEKDREVTNYLVSIRALDIIVNASMQADGVKIHNEISLNEIEGLNDNNVLYHSHMTGVKVFKGTWKGIPVAVKEFLTETMSFNLSEFHKEITLLSIIDASRHPNICRFFGASTNPKKPLMVMPLFPCGSLAGLCNLEKKKNSVVVDNSLIVNMAMKAANGINFLHSRKIIHRDIKCQNFLIDEHFNVYVIDFGVSRVADESDPNAKMTIIGTTTWMAPEVLDGLKYNYKADSYSFALVLWMMASGREPYSNFSNPLVIPSEVVNNKYREKIPDTLPPKIIKLISICWDPDPEQRLDFDQILDTLYEIEDPSYKHKKIYYCRVHEALEDKQFYKLFDYLELVDLHAFAVTSKRYNKITVEYIKLTGKEVPKVQRQIKVSEKK